MKSYTKLLLLIYLLILGGLAWRPVLAQGALGPGYYDNNLPLIDYVGTWTGATITSAGYYQDSRHFSSTYLDSLELDFWGDGISIRFAAYSGGPDNVLVCVNAICSSISLMADPVVFVTVDVLYVGYGVHTLEVIHNMNAAGRLMIVDAFHVLPPPPQPTLPPQEIEIHATIDVNLSGEITPEPYIDIFDLTDSDGNTQTVSFSRQMDAGQVFNGIVDVGILFLVLIGFGFWMWRTRGATKDE